MIDRLAMPSYDQETLARGQRSLLLGPQKNSVVFPAAYAPGR
jgi:hypothetical protein